MTHRNTVAPWDQVCGDVVALGWRRRDTTAPGGGGALRGAGLRYQRKSCRVQGQTEGCALTA